MQCFFRVHSIETKLKLIKSYSEAHEKIYSFLMDHMWGGEK